MSNALRRSQQDAVGSLAEEMLHSPGFDASDELDKEGVDELREKIKSARLEKLMARQLESELSIDGLEPISSSLSEDDFDRWIMSDDMSTLNANETSNANTPDPLAAPDPLSIAKAAQLNIPKPATSDLIQDEVDEVKQMIKSGMDMVDKLNAHSEGLKTSLGKFENDFSRLAMTKRQLQELEDNHKKLVKDYKEASNFISQQRKQVGILEARLNKTSTESAQYRSKLIGLQEKYDELNRRSLEQQGAHHAKFQELEHKLRELHGELEVTRRDKAQAITELKAANSLLVLHDEMMETLSQKAPEES